MSNGHGTYTWKLEDFAGDGFKIARTKMYGRREVQGYWIVANETPRVFVRHAANNWVMYEAYTGVVYASGTQVTYRDGSKVNDHFCKQLENVLAEALMHVVAEDA